MRGAEPHVPRGDWEAGRRVVVVAFPTSAELDAWYHSDDYAPALELSAAALDRRLLFVSGVDEPGQSAWA